MKLHPMTKSHETTSPAPWLWSLPAAAARRLQRSSSNRWLAVQDGRVWLTRSGRELQTGEDIWLSAGQHLLLPAGSEWVIEGWPQARVTMLQAPEGDDLLSAAAPGTCARPSGALPSPPDA